MGNTTSTQAAQGRGKGAYGLGMQGTRRAARDQTYCGAEGVSPRNLGDVLRSRECSTPGCRCFASSSPRPWGGRARPSRVLLLCCLSGGLARVPSGRGWPSSSRSLHCLCTHAATLRAVLHCKEPARVELSRQAEKTKQDRRKNKTKDNSTRPRSARVFLVCCEKVSGYCRQSQVKKGFFFFFFFFFQFFCCSSLWHGNQPSL